MNVRVGTIVHCVLAVGTLLTHAQTTSPQTDGEPPTTILVGKNIPILSKFEGLPVVEPHISAHPGDNNHLLAAAMIVTDIDRPYESCRLSSFVSRDAGQTWTETAHDWWDYDPWTAILSDGSTALSWIGTKGRFIDQYPIQFFSSSNGGVTWSDQVQTLEGMYDGTKITAFGQEFYFTTVRFNDAGGADVILCRRHGTEPFEEVAKIDSAGKRLNFCEPAILSDGKVLVPAAMINDRAWVQIYDHATRELSPPREMSRQPGGSKGYMRFVADNSHTSPFRDHVYFVRAVGAGTDFQGIWINVSRDGGLTWGPDERVDLFANASASRAMTASVAVNPQGVLGISWVDSQHDTAHEKYDLYFTVSRDGGASFELPVRVSSVSSDPRSPRNADVANKFTAGGHYLGLAAKPDGSFQLLWSDSRNGLFQLQTCNVKVDADR